MIERLVLFGATGDLAGRFLLPALAALQAARKLPGGFQIVGASRERLDDAAFRRVAADRLAHHAAHVAAGARESLVRLLSYRGIDLAAPESVASVVRGDTRGTSRLSPRPLAAYLALPPAVFSTGVKALHAVGLPPGSRIVLEKPFGEDLESAAALNALLEWASGAEGERAVFRVDHVLGMATVQNLLGLRLANRIFESVWNSANIEQIEILWEETLALEGRAGYYDRAGALKDVMQNHMLQVLCLVAMEPPATLSERDLRDRKVQLLRSVRPVQGSRSRRARYTAGRLADDAGGAGREIPAYAEEHGVDPKRGTETFAEVVLDLDTPRWTGTRFVLRAGKALARRRKEVVFRFRPLPHLPFGNQSRAAQELRIGLDGPEDLRLHFAGNVAGGHLVPLTLTGEPPPSDLPPYGRVLLDILEGESTLSVRGDEAAEAWRIVMPVLQAWADGRVPLEEYQAGSTGPPTSDPHPAAGR
jgi:glucose-6-phosphate 1-dehydrogenase